MVSQSENDSFAPSNSPELINWIDGESQTQKGILFIIHHNLKEMMYRVIGVSMPFVASAIIGVLSIFALQTKIGILAIFGLTLLLLAVSVGTTTISLTVWRIGQWFRFHLGNHWKHRIPTHNFETSGFSIHTFRQVQKYVSHESRINNRYNQQTRPSSSSFYVGCWLVFRGYTAQLILTTILVIISNLSYFDELNEVAVGGNVSTPAAFLSALLGPLVGVVTIGIASIADSLENFIVFSLLFVLPAYFIAPGVQNLIEWSEAFHREQENYFSTIDSASAEKTKRVILFGFIYLALDGWILYQVIQSQM